MTRTTRLWSCALAAALLLPVAAYAAPAAAAGPGPAHHETRPHRSVVGTWISPRGGADRAYERRITFERDGRFAMQERVAPCPPRVQCVWSGIVDIDGTYRIERGEVVLTYAVVGSHGIAELPATLEQAGPYLVQKLEGYGRAVYVKTG
ncbi:hypothetical protein [Streptomyces indicus]|uniref:Lipocalin-like domain-containing protein n=1 Tax=Streptomyces indicus TaxID=417292 RepID=A0A1G8UL29_9ACTN|nr:hypothetical protein [Streptomyces indicus]SDJ54429.1 hypothetical protein SAMN05421806_101918 [Streptomyces indicus]